MILFFETFMKILSYGLAIGVTALSSAMTSASIASWVTSPEQGVTTQEHVKEQTQVNTSADTINSNLSEISTTPVVEFTKPARLDVVPQTNTVANPTASIKSNIQSAVPTDDTASKHLAETSAFVNNPSVRSLKSEEYLAIVLLNSALVQAGLDVKLSTSNQTTRNLFNNAVGCINSKKSESLNAVAKNLISDHSKIVDIRSFVKSSPSIGSTFTASCM